MGTQTIVALSGNDIFSGGGLSADLGVYAAHKLHGFVAVTCLTAVTDKGFEVFPTADSLFAHQLASLQDLPLSAIKIGLLPTVSIAEQALAFVKQHVGIPVVLDPVLVCKETHDREVSQLRDELLRFLPHVNIVTPNLAEAQLLTQMEIDSLDGMKEAARRLYELGARQVVIKGGNRLNKETAIDVLYDGTDHVVFEAPVLEKNNAGAGCAFASSIASQLALGQSVQQAVSLSKEYVYRAIQAANAYGVCRYEIN